MKEILKKYNGVIFFYLTIVGAILLINMRMDYFEQKPDSVTYAISK